MPEAAPGWYPDPQGPGARRWWDGSAWTEHVAAEGPAPGAPAVPPSSSRNWAVAAHLSAIPAMVVAMAFLGPLAIYLVKTEDPYVRQQAREALNFQLSMLFYGLLAFLAMFLIIGFFAVIVLGAALLLLAVGWLVLVGLAALRAGRGEAFRYPLTIRFVR